MAAAKKLAESLSPASFRGVPFQVETADLGAGRRTQLHEYPQRDKPYAEDLGRATRELTFTGFVVGADYVDQANKLLAALEERGPGTLVHPWLGTQTVSLKEPARVSFDAALGVARFSLAFVESGALEFPAAATSTPVETRNAATALETSAVESFAKQFSISGFQDFVSSAANAALADVLGVVALGEIGKLFAYSSSLANTVSTVIGLVSNPATLGWKLLGLVGLSGIASTVSAWVSLVRSLTRSSRSHKLAPPASPSLYTPSRQQAYVNTSAINALTRQALLAQAVGASSLIGSAVDAHRPTYEDYLSVRDDLAAALDEESLTATDTVYPILQAARQAVWQDLTARARDNARLTTLTPAEVLPAVVIAYDYYEEASRDDEIIARNALRHPGFVPANPLKVLTR